MHHFVSKINGGVYPLPETPIGTEVLKDLIDEESNHACISIARTAQIISGDKTPEQMTEIVKDAERPLDKKVEKEQASLKEEAKKLARKAKAEDINKFNEKK